MPPLENSGIAPPTRTRGRGAEARSPPPFHLCPAPQGSLKRWASQAIGSGQGTHEDPSAGATDDAKALKRAKRLAAERVLPYGRAAGSPQKVQLTGRGSGTGFGCAMGGAAASKSDASGGVGGGPESGDGGSGGSGGRRRETTDEDVETEPGDSDDKGRRSGGSGGSGGSRGNGGPCSGPSS